MILLIHGKKMSAGMSHEIIFKYVTLIVHETKKSEIFRLIDEANYILREFHKDLPYRFIFIGYSIEVYGRVLYDTTCVNLQDLRDPDEKVKIGSILTDTAFILRPNIVHQCLMEDEYVSVKFDDNN